MFFAAVSTLAFLVSAGPVWQSQLQAVSEAEATPQTAPPHTPSMDQTAMERPGESTLRGEILPADNRVLPSPPPEAGDSDRRAAETPAAEPSTPETPMPETPLPETSLPEPAGSETSDPVARQRISDQLPEAYPDPAIVPEGWPEILTAARLALKETRTAKGRFVQTNADGTVARGDFALNRPGRLRFAYDAPVPVLIVADGSTVAIEDSELETVDRVPLGATPLGIILDREVDFDGEVDVLGIRQAGESIGIEMRDSAGEMDGTLTLIFSLSDYALLGWMAVDGNRQATLVNLEGVTTNIRIDPRLFRLDEAEDEEDER